jgi:chromosome segregation ATPase
MLTEYLDKNNKLEERVSELTKELRSNEESYLSHLKERDDQLAQLQEELGAAQALVSDLEQQNESLRSEMEALSSAYSSLEQEYHSKSSSSLPTGEVSGQEGAEAR